MSLFEPFSHYLAYLATDQETYLDLRGQYDGLLVPGTIAAWQRQGTGGFVLSLSAAAGSPPYVIDPRFPLFQQALRSPKQSHIALAEIFGDLGLVQTEDPPFAEQFDVERLAEIAQRWVEFNTQYGETSNQNFDKYAKRLEEEPPKAANAQAPAAILAPYFVARSSDDPWWARSTILHEKTCQAADGKTCFRVVAADDVNALDGLLADTKDKEVIVWVSALDEHKAVTAELTAYRGALAAASARGQHAFALYGGFFSVLQASAGLVGAAHGVGFSEHRDWHELPRSGAPQARFYMRRWHRYVQVDFAQTIWNQDPDLCWCSCEHCGDSGPNTMSYHDLMKHSVACRKEEIDQWSGISAGAAAHALGEEHKASVDRIEELELLPNVRKRALELVSHLHRWAEALG